MSCVQLLSAVHVILFVVILSQVMHPGKNTSKLSLEVLPSETDKNLVSSLGRASGGLRSVVSNFSAEPALSDSLWMHLGCVQTVRLALVLQPLKQGVHGCSPSFSGLYKEDERLKEAKNNCAVQEHRRGLFGFCGPLLRCQSSHRLWSSRKG